MIDQLVSDWWPAFNSWLQGAANQFALGAVIISLIALVYSRLAYRFQVNQALRRHVDSFVLSANSSGVRLSNPEERPILAVRGRYHHRVDGTIPFYVGQEDASKQQLEIELASPMGRYLGGRRRRALGGRPKKKKYRRLAIAEVQLIDGSGEEWRISSDGHKIHLPRRLLRRIPAQIRSYVVVYPPWGGLTPWHWSGLGFLALTLYIIAQTSLPALLR